MFVCYSFQRLSRELDNIATNTLLSTHLRLRYTIRVVQLYGV
jgi:hypothetical protein